MFNFQVKKKIKVFIPESIVNDKKDCYLYGYYKKDSGVFNVVSTVYKKGLKKLGQIGKKNDLDHNYLSGFFDDDELKFFFKGVQYDVELYSLYLNIFSRNKGILETDKMSKKGVIILGCGSVGSLVAMELARSGVTHFLLIDTDIVEFHNICRHQCGIDDVGEYKVAAVKKRILNINPTAKVVTKVSMVENINQKEFMKFCDNLDVAFIGCADNRRADVYANMVAAKFKAPFISIGFWERAAAGEIYYWLPGQKMPCYRCALGSGETARIEVNNHHVYSNQVDINELKFEPGISVDINFITIVGIKLILDILNRNDKTFIPRLLNDLKQFTLICNTSNPKIGGEMVEIFSYPLQVTTSLVVNFKQRCQKICNYEV